MSGIDGNIAKAKGFNKGTWKLQVDGNHWQCVSPKFGEVEYFVVTDKDGNPQFDRPRYHEAPHIITVVWGKKKEEYVYIGLVLEARPHAIPYDSSSPYSDVKFWGVPRGFLNAGETPEEAARREAGEESGAAVVLESKEAGYIYPNPTFCATFGPVIFLKVDLDRLEAIRPTRGEKIYKAQFFAEEQVKQMIVRGKYGDGLLEDGVSLAALMKFFAVSPSVR